MKKGLKKDPEWSQWKQGLHLNTWWLSRGLVVVSRHSDFNHYAGKKKLQVNQTTTLQYHDIAIAQSNDVEYKKKITSNVSSSNDSSSSVLIESMSSLDKKVKSKAHSVVYYFSILQTFAQQENLPLPFMLDEKVYFENKESHDIFIPVSFSNTKMQAVQFYFSLPLNLASNDDFSVKFNGVKVFVTAGCMFGTSLQGLDGKDSPVPIIRHKINFVEGEKIVRIDSIDEELHPYEIAQFNFLKDVLPFMEKISDKRHKPELVYHLPAHDYILSIIKLFVQNKISYEALLDCYSAIKKRSQTHIKILESIFKNSTITLSIESPFMNLLQDFFVNDDYEIVWLNDLVGFNQIVVDENKIYVTINEDGNLIYKMRSPSGIEKAVTAIKCISEEFPPANADEMNEQLLELIDSKGHARGVNAFLLGIGIPIQEKPFTRQKELERAVVTKILKMLVENEISIRHQTIWKDFLKINSGKDRINSLESLFKIANAVMIARAAKGEEDYTVCSFLPLNEKPIFTKYLNCAEKLAEQEISYPKVFPLVALERLICYSHLAKGNAFYFHSSPTLAKCITQGALTNPREYFGFFSEQYKASVRSKRVATGANVLPRTLSF